MAFDPTQFGGIKVAQPVKTGAFDPTKFGGVKVAPRVTLPQRNAPTNNFPARQGASSFSDVFSGKPVFPADVNSKGVGGVVGNVARTFGNIPGDVAGILGSTVQNLKAIPGAFAGAMSAAPTVEQGVKNIGAGFADTAGKIGSAIGGAIQDPAKTLQSVAASAIEHPVTTAIGLDTGGSAIGKDVGAAATDIAKGTGQAVVQSAKDLATPPVVSAAKGLVGIVPKTAEEAKVSAVSNMNKALGVTGKKSAGGLLADMPKKLTGMETILEQGKGLTVKGIDGVDKAFDPFNTNFWETIQAFNQVKQNMWGKIEAGLEKGSSVTPNIDGVVNSLKKIASDTSGRTGEAKSWAAKRLSEVQNLTTPTQIQAYLKDINTRIGQVVVGASDAVGASIDGEIAHGLNNALDTALSQMKGASIRPWKNRYAGLKSIENDMVRKTQVMMRQAQPGSGVANYLNEFGDLNIVESIVAHNPYLFLVKGVGMKTMAKFNNWLKDPNRFLSNTFKDIQQYGGIAPVPESPTLALPPASSGFRSVMQGGAPIKIPPRAPVGTFESTLK